MATREFVEEKLANSIAKLEKSNSIIEKKSKLLAKKQKALESLTDSNEIYWAKCDIETLESDIHYKKLDIERNIQPAIDKWSRELIKINSIVRDCKPVLEFLEMWKKSCRNFYILEKYSSDRKKMRNEWLNADSDYCHWRNEERWKDTRSYEEKRIESIKRYEVVKELKRAYYDRFAFVESLEDKARCNKTSYEEELDKHLNREADAKYDKLIADVTSKVGTITNVSELTVSKRGELNGFVEGKNGRCSVNTILAGGYNIQCLHFRCLIHKV